MRGGRPGAVAPETLGDEMLGDEMLGDEMLGDEMLGDEVLGEGGGVKPGGSFSGPLFSGSPNGFIGAGGRGCVGVKPLRLAGRATTPETGRGAPPRPNRPPLSALIPSSSKNADPQRPHRSTAWLRTAISLMLAWQEAHARCLGPGAASRCPMPAPSSPTSSTRKW